MKRRTTLGLLMLIPLLASCGPKGDLEIPPVDVLSMQLNLPTKPTYNVGEIRQKDGNDVLDVYELSDFHGAVNFDEGSECIGLPRLATYFTQKRAENPGGTILVSSGDMFQGSCESNLTRGYMVNYAMNYMGFDAMSVGNHEFDWTETWIKNNAELAYNGHVTPMLGANIVYKTNNQRPTYLKGSTTIERGQYKVGIVGSIGAGLTKSILASAVEPFRFTHEATAVNSEVEALKNNGCNVVVWNSHNSLDYLVTVAADVNGVDVGFGGHAHVNDVNRESNPKLIATKNNGGSVAHAEIQLDKVTKEVKKVSVDYKTFQEIGAKSLAEDENIKSIMNQYNSDIDKVKNIELGKTDGKLARATELCNICTKAMHTSVTKFIQDNPQYGINADEIVAAYHNGTGGVRKDIEKGKIFYGNVYQACPFDNEIVLAKVKGYNLMSGSYYGFGVYHPNENTNSLTRSNSYYVALNDYIATSVLGYDEEDLVRTGLIIRDEVAKFIYKENSIKVKDYARTIKNFKHFE